MHALQISNKYVKDINSEEPDEFRFTIVGKIPWETREITNENTS